MRKKVKSPVEDGPYEKLAVLFKENYVDMGISYCDNRYIKEFVEYLQSVKGGRRKVPSYYNAHVFYNRNKGKRTYFQKIRTRHYQLKKEVGMLQDKFNTYIKKNPDSTQELDAANLNDELQFTKLVQILLKITWEEKKTGRALTEDETRDLMGKIGGQDFLKSIRARIKPLTDKLDSYDPDLRGLFDKIENTLLKNKTVEDRTF